MFCLSLKYVFDKFNKCPAVKTDEIQDVI